MRELLLGIEIILVVLLIYFIAIGLIGLFLYNINFMHRCNKGPDKIMPRISDFPDLVEKRTEFKCGKNTLAGYSYTHKSMKTYKGIVVVVHGHNYTHDNYIPEINFFCQKGYKVFSYDGTGCGESTGITMKGYPQWIKDLRSAILFLNSQKEFKNLDIFLFGHSIGGFAVTAILNFKDIKIKAVAACSAVDSGKAYVKQFSKDKPGLFSKSIYLFFVFYERLLFGNIANYTGSKGINNSKVKALVIHSRDDKYVPVSCSVYGYRKEVSNKNAQFILLENKGHFVFKSQECIEYLNSKDNEEDRKKVYLLDKDIMDKIERFFC